MGKIVISTKRPRSMEWSRTPTVRRASGWAAGSSRMGGKGPSKSGGKVEYGRGAAHWRPLLLGRRSDEWFGARWASRPGEWAGPAEQPAQVRSCHRTLEDPRWTNVTVLKGKRGRRGSRG